MPTEAQWEYAAQGGKFSRGLIYAGSNNPMEVAWYDDNSQNISQPVGRKRPNELGLYDMSGNLFEWCQDWYDENYYETCAQQEVVHNPEGPKNETFQVFRGGSWLYDAYSCRVAFRDFNRPGLRYNFDGLRLSRY